MRKLIAMIGLALIVSACVEPEGVETDSGYTSLDGGNYAKYVVINGVPCIVVYGWEAVAVSCDWNN